MRRRLGTAIRARGSAARGEDGAALVLVLIVITVIALTLGALLSRSDTSIRTTVGLRDQVAATYNADGAMQAAVNNLRNSTYNDSAGQKCFGASNTLQLDNFYGADSAAVTCSADPKKVLIQCPSLSSCNRPGNAILSLGRVAGEDGLHIDQPTGSTFRVHGNVFSNSNINVFNGALNTNANVWARTTCSGVIQSTPPPSCNYGNTSNELGDDKNYPALATIAALPHRTLPSCTTPNSVIRFEPGYYDDAYGLSNMMAGNSPCKNSTWWFPPVYDGSGNVIGTGIYYFDFHNSGTTANPLLQSSGGNVWTLNDGNLVAGTPVNAAGAALAAPPVPPTIPGSCDNPIKNANAVGVQFIFGGDSRFEVKSGQAEICGTYNVDRPPIALYGLSSGSAATTTWTGADALTMSSVVGAGPYSNPSRVAVADGQVATWAKAGNSQETGSLTVKGYTPPSSIPAGSVLTSAKLVAVHGNTAGSTQDDLSVTINPAGGTLFTVPVPSYADNAMHTDSLDVLQNGTGTLARLVYDGTFNGANITYSAKLKHPGTEQVDALRLELTFVPPALRANSGCVTNTPYTGGGSSAATCALVSTVNNNANQFYVQGTTYTPAAAVDIILNNAAEQVFRFGVIARSVWVKETGSFSYGGVVIEVPDDSPGFVFSMYLTAYICPNSSSCTPAGAGALKAKVALVDSNPSTPVPGRRQVTVLSWTRPG
jgi:Tfp pilus assembly protein PilX